MSCLEEAHQAIMLATKDNLSDDLYLQKVTRPIELSKSDQVLTNASSVEDREFKILLTQVHTPLDHRLDEMLAAILQATQSIIHSEIIVSKEASRNSEIHSTRWDKAKFHLQGDFRTSSLLMSSKITTLKCQLCTRSTIMAKRHQSRGKKSMISIYR